MRTHLGRMEAFDALLESRRRPGAVDQQRSIENPPARADETRRDGQRSSVMITPEGGGRRSTGR